MRGIQNSEQKPFAQLSSVYVDDPHWTAIT
jgi:hypothetical protein